MDDIIVWLIVIGFYIPLHIGLPLLVVFLSSPGNEVSLKQQFKSVIIDAVISLVVAFVVAISLVTSGYMTIAMFVLLLMIPFPIVRYILKNKRR